MLTTKKMMRGGPIKRDDQDSVAATPTRSRPEVKVETWLAENFVVTPRTRSATRSAELATTARL